MTNTDESIALKTWLPQFFDRYRACSKPRLDTWLSHFFSDYRAHRTHFVPRANDQASKPFQIDAIKLNTWLAELTQSMEDMHRGALQFDPWKVAGLGRDEVRNSAVLAWLLNPKGSHGLGNAPMRGLLGDLHRFDNRFPKECSQNCRVRLESNPDGDRGNRVDIEIDDIVFYALIEVKLGAAEGPNQIQRYGEIAQKLADNRPWAIVFLTPGGVKSNTAGKHEDRVLPLSWRQLALSISQSIENDSVHTSVNRGPMRHMADQAVQCFLKKMRNF